MPPSCGSSTTTSPGPRCLRWSGLRLGTQAQLVLEPLHCWWSMTATLPLWFRRTILMTTRIAIDIPPKIATVCFLGTISILGAISLATILRFLPTTPRSRFAYSSFSSSLAWFPLSQSSTIGLVLSFHVIFWLCAFWGIWFVFLWIFFFLYLCLCLVAQKMWKRNENLDFSWSLKKPTKFGTV